MFIEIELLCVQVKVTIQNNQLYRHVERPGWRLSWAWPGHEYISTVLGAETTEQGNCTGLHAVGGVRPHCCDKQPVMVDLLPSAPYNRRSGNCCRGGVLSSIKQNNGAASSAQFDMYVSNFVVDQHGHPEMPTNFSVGVRGYSCSNATQMAPTRVKIDQERHEQYLLTWRVVCSYSQFMDAPSPSCCVSLSSFYSETLVGCPLGSCGLPNTPSALQCLSGGDQPKNTAALPDADGNWPTPVIRCTEHMCPIRVHWHVQRSYRGYWRVKTTVTNYDVVNNYSEWNVVVQHPALESLTQVYSFNYAPLLEYDTVNDTGLFWGIKNFNARLLADGSVQTEMLLKKDPGFTFSGGWAFPRRVYFDGRQCVMPAPDQYPSLPSAAWGLRVSALHLWLLACSFLLVSVFLLV